MRLTFLGVTFWMLVAVPPAEGRLVGSSYDSGSYPFVFLISDTLPRARSFSVTLMTVPFAPLDSHSSWSVSCVRDSENRAIELPFFGPGTYTSGPTLANGACRVSATASFADIMQQGSISLTAYGESKPKRKRR